MGKRRAVRLAIAKADNEVNDDLRREVANLNQMTENLQILLRQETDKNAVLEAKLKELSANAEKKSPKKTTVKKTEE